ncbi:hypothetical protein PMIN06_004947 [Paraphaeosphaeria minitans]
MPRLHFSHDPSAAALSRNASTALLQQSQGHRLVPQCLDCAAQQSQVRTYPVGVAPLFTSRKLSLEAGWACALLCGAGCSQPQRGEARRRGQPPLCFVSSRPKSPFLRRFTPSRVASLTCNSSSVCTLRPCSVV